jgi:signal transduction histidine kinase
VRAFRLWLWPAGAVVGITAEWVYFDWGDWGDWLPDLATGWTLIACGLIAWGRRPESRSGPLLAATGFTWFAANFASDQALYLHRGPLIQLVLSYPYGRLKRPLDRFAVAVGYGAAVVPAVWSNDMATFALSALFVAVAGHGYVRALGRERRTRLVALVATVFVAAVMVGTAAARLASPTAELTDATLLVYEAALCVLAVALLFGLVVEPWARTKVADLVVDLGQADSGTLRDALAQALGDPTLEIGYWLDRGYVDSEGRPLVLPAEGSDRAVTSVNQDGKAIAVLVHDEAVLDDPRLSHALARAARLAAANARLQAEVRTQVVELAESRRRLVDAGDEERRRLERRLHETVERRLTALVGKLEDAERAAADAAHLSRVRQQLDRTLDELQDLAAGLHPGGLEEGGLSAALASLAARSPVPVDLRITEVGVPEALERATYFVCSEALANVIKYANASSVVISVGERAERLHVEITDDGVGGAMLGGGSGLSGLADRVEALGGKFQLDSPAGHGTRLSVELPQRVEIP